MKTTRLISDGFSFAARTVPELVRRCELYALEVSSGLDRATRYRNGVEHLVEFADTVATATVEHGLLETPDRFTVTYASAAQALGMTSADERECVFTRSSTTGAESFRVLIYRDVQ